MEAFFAWLLQNVAWDTLKKALPKAKQRDLNLFKQALADAQARLKELEQDRVLLEKLVDQRNRRSPSCPKRTAGSGNSNPSW